MGEEEQFHQGAAVQISGIPRLDATRAIVLHKCREGNWAGRWAVQSEGKKFAAKPENLRLLASAADRRDSKALLTNMYGRMCRRRSEAVEVVGDSGAAYVSLKLPASIVSKASESAQTDASSPANRLMTKAASLFSHRDGQARLPGH